MLVTLGTERVKRTSIKLSPTFKRSLTKVLEIFPLITVKLTCIKQSPLFGGHSHLFRGPNDLFFIVFISIKRSLREDVPC